MQRMFFAATNTSMLYAFVPKSLEAFVQALVVHRIANGVYWQLDRERLHMTGCRLYVQPAMLYDESCELLWFM